MFVPSLWFLFPTCIWLINLLINLQIQQLAYLFCIHQKDKAGAILVHQYHFTFYQWLPILWSHFFWFTNLKKIKIIAIYLINQHIFYNIKFNIYIHLSEIFSTFYSLYLHVLQKPRDSHVSHPSLLATRWLKVLHTHSQASKEHAPNMKSLLGWVLCTRTTWSSSHWCWWHTDWESMHSIYLPTLHWLYSKSDHLWSPLWNWLFTWNTNHMKLINYMNSYKAIVSWFRLDISKKLGNTQIQPPRQYCTFVSIKPTYVTHCECAVESRDEAHIWSPASNVDVICRAVSQSESELEPLATRICKHTTW